MITFNSFVICSHKPKSPSDIDKRPSDITRRLIDEASAIQKYMYLLFVVTILGMIFITKDAYIVSNWRYVMLTVMFAYLFRVAMYDKGYRIIFGFSKDYDFALVIALSYTVVLVLLLISKDTADVICTLLIYDILREIVRVVIWSIVDALVNGNN
jgi:hypothetical protein